MPLMSCSSINTKSNFTVHVIITTIIIKLLETVLKQRLRVTRIILFKRRSAKLANDIIYPSVQTYCKCLSCFIILLHKTVLNIVSFESKLNQRESAVWSICCCITSASSQPLDIWKSFRKHFDLFLFIIYISITMVCVCV